VGEEGTGEVRSRGWGRLHHVGQEGRGHGAAPEGAQSKVVRSLCSCAGSSYQMFLCEVEEKRKEKTEKRKERKRGKEKEKINFFSNLKLLGEKNKKQFMDLI
jgi:hypothetical protein